MTEKKKGLTYADAGVNIDAGNRAVELMKDSVRATFYKGSYRRCGRIRRTVQPVGIYVRGSCSGIGH